jgi:hypothetical protein
VAKNEISLPVVKVNSKAPNPKAKATGVSSNNKPIITSIHSKKIIIIG